MDIITINYTFQYIIINTDYIRIYVQWYIDLVKEVIDTLCSYKPYIIQYDAIFPKHQYIEEAKEKTEWGNKNLIPYFEKINKRYENRKDNQ